MSFSRAIAFSLVLTIAAQAWRLQADLPPPGSGVAGSQPGSPRKTVLPADDDGDDDNPSRTPGASAPPARYLFGLLDHRSAYGKDFFQDPFLGPEFDRETQIELDYAHGEGRAQQTDEGGAQFQWNVLGQFTLAGEAGYDAERARTGGEREGSGFENVGLAVYHPVFQAVNEDGAFDYTAVLRLDVGIPTHTPASGTDVLLTPYLGQLLRVGEHVGMEAWTGAQFTLASRQTTPFIYGASLGYRITRSQAALPLTRTVTPLFEIDGQTPFSNHGPDALFGVAGFNWEFAAVREWRPRISVGYQFPLDHAAREQLRWGIVTQIFFDF